MGDSHEYGLSPDPFDRKLINDLILGYLEQFATCKHPKIIETWNGIYESVPMAAPTFSIHPKRMFSSSME
ncbi:MAG: hypothetical protein WDM78_05045 [Puia sp.]